MSEESKEETVPGYMEAVEAAIKEEFGEESVGRIREQSSGAIEDFIVRFIEQREPAIRRDAERKLEARLLSNEARRVSHRAAAEEIKSVATFRSEEQWAIYERTVTAALAAALKATKEELEAQLLGSEGVKALRGELLAAQEEIRRLREDSQGPHAAAIAIRAYEESSTVKCETRPMLNALAAVAAAFKATKEEDPSD